MLLKDKIAVIYGAGGYVGGAVAEAFAREGARLFLAGRTQAPLERLAARLGGDVETAQVDAMDEAAVEGHMAGIADRAGRIDVVFNAIGPFTEGQGVPLTDITLDAFQHPIVTMATSQFLTSRTAARHMARQGAGVILTLSASPARLAIGMTGGFAVACDAVEGLSRTLAGELGPKGIRVVCIRPHRIEGTLGAEAEVPMSMEAFQGFLKDMTLTKRLPTLAQVGSTAAFLASDHAGAMSGTVANLTGGTSVD